MVVDASIAVVVNLVARFCSAGEDHAIGIIAVAAVRNVSCGLCALGDGVCAAPESVAIVVNVPYRGIYGRFVSIAIAVVIDLIADFCSVWRDECVCIIAVVAIGGVSRRCRTTHCGDVCVSKSITVIVLKLRADGTRFIGASIAVVVDAMNLNTLGWAKLGISQSPAMVTALAICMRRRVVVTAKRVPIGVGVKRW